jgi:hypothetical protein
VATVDVGTPVFATPKARLPWARVSGTDSVYVILVGDRARIVEAPGLDVRSPGAMWVPSDRLHVGVSSEHGMTVRQTTIAGRAVVEVSRVNVGSRGWELGLRMGDVIDRVGGADVGGWSADGLRVLLNSNTGPFSVIRRGERVALFNACTPPRTRARGCCSI